MVVRVIEAKEDKVTTADLIAELKKSSKIDYSGAIFTFEGIVRGKEENMNLTFTKFQSFTTSVNSILETCYSLLRF